MDLYIKIFGATSLRDVSLYNRRQKGQTFEELAKMFRISRQRCQQIHAKMEGKLKLFVMLMKMEMEEREKEFIANYIKICGLRSNK